ncbi:uncharacterized protein LOC109862770 [Pseudomyrmex gracilis]|uniref:uncharacterized protein LOC109862770 n=1 Tax=Pseudomyrmex gracilis TaxID=219809 RepID=UPI000995454A|nr:uncharacterized protein LOC109862770 [Pseudomyrmex gracilis]
MALKLPRTNENSLFLFPTDFTEIYNIIHDIKEKAGGVDNLNIKTLKTISDYIAEPLAYVLNLCMEQSFWPNALKNADVFWLLKQTLMSKCEYFIIYNNLDVSKPTITTFIDLTKAFDTVNHGILLEKLYNYGIREQAYRLILSYLTDRQQRVKINSVYSEYNIIDTEVSQGIILGPLLFIMYVNNLLFGMPQDSIISYANDTVILVKDL